MTIRNAGKICELTITRLDVGHWRANGLLGEFEVEAADEKEAASKIVDQNWRLVCRERSRQQGHRCLECRQFGALHGHHRIFRSQGRRDVVENTDMWCAGCHGAKFGPHGRKS